jgi:hypothetical protein
MPSWSVRWTTWSVREIESSVELFSIGLDLAP